jgi:hypothetical protein
MQHDAFRNFWTAVQDASHDIARACRRIVRAVAVMPWPAVLVCSIGLALVISILPLGLLLFLLFMAVKVVIGAFVIDSRHPAPSKYEEPHGRT